MSQIEFTTKVSVTPKEVAEFFWGMSDREQAQFFEELYEITKQADAYGNGEMQWCYMSDELEKSPKAKQQACAMMVWIFNRATDYLSRQPTWEYYYD
jgi:hypothetical protein